MSASEVNLYADQGTTFKTEFIIEDDSGVPVDITSFTITSQIRKSFGSTVAIPFTVTKTDAANGVVELSLTPLETAAIKSGRYVYDAQYATVGDVVRFVKGIFTIYPSVTR